MNSDRILSVVLAACCLFALGASASTLDSSVDTTPDDVIDVDVGTLPLPSDDVAKLKKQVQSEGTSDRTVSGRGDPPETGPTEERTRQRPTGGSSSGPAPDDSGDMDGPSQDEGSTPAPVPPTLVDRLLSLLRALLEFLLSVLPALVAVGLLAAAVRFRDRLRTAGARLAGRLGGDATSSDDAPVPAPSNDVEAAWYEMVSRVGLDVQTRTPRECANEAKDAGVDPEIADSLTTLFERVTYGGQPVTDRRRTRAQRAVRRLRGEGAAR